MKAPTLLDAAASWAGVIRGRLSGSARTMPSSTQAQQPTADYQTSSCFEAGGVDMRQSTLAVTMEQQNSPLLPPAPESRADR